MTGRAPVAGFANYAGNVSTAIGEVMGPNDFGELLTVVQADFDSTTNTTRLGFAYAGTDDIMAAASVLGTAA